MHWLYQFIVGWGCLSFFVIIIYKKIKSFFLLSLFFSFILVLALQNFLLSFENCLFLSELFVELKRYNLFNIMGDLNYSFNRRFV